MHKPGFLINIVSMLFNCTQYFYVEQSHMELQISTMFTKGQSIRHHFLQYFSNEYSQLSESTLTRSLRLPGDYAYLFIAKNFEADAAWTDEKFGLNRVWYSIETDSYSCSQLTLIALHVYTLSIKQMVCHSLQGWLTPSKALCWLQNTNNYLSALYRTGA